MNVIRHSLRRCCPQTNLRRGLRRLPNRSTTIESPEIPVLSVQHTPVLQIPLTEQDLTKLAEDEPRLKEDKSVKPKKDIPVKQKKEKIPLHERVKPEVNPPLSEPITPENQYEKLAEVVTPLYKIPYRAQLNLKKAKVMDIMKTLGNRLAHIDAPICKMKKGHLCPVEAVIPSPEVTAYRNKDEFGIHFGVDGDPKTVGFFVGKPTDPLMRCVPATYLINMRDSHKQVAQRFQTFIRQSHHKACHRFDNDGIWRNVLIRSTRLDERMATVYIHPQDLREDEVLEIMADLEKFFFDGEGADCELDSLYLQTTQHTRCTREQAPYRLIRGKEYVTEMCEGLKFQISPDSFFQINTGSAELLYKVVREIAEVSPFTTLLDACCGTGTISLVMAPYVRGVVGIEATTGAVEDAKRNAAINSVSNVHFIGGRAEKVLPNLTDELSHCTDVVAVLNPARAGLRADVIKAIRECESISKIVYISCKPEGTSMENFVQLCTMKAKGNMKNKTPPFIPKYVVPVDMFPHTHHTEVVILFDRVTM